MLGNSWRQWLHHTRKTFAKCTGKSNRRRRTIRPCLEALENRTTPTSISLTSSADNTLYQVSSSDPAQQLSNGAGPTLFAGDTNQTTNNIRRGLIKFDLSGVPMGSTITSATLTLHVAKAVSSVSQTMALSRALDAWGEGTSISGGGGGGGAGAPATTGDATWFYAILPTQTWTTPGGDFASTASASTAVNGTGFFSWAGSGLSADVQQWVNNPAGNFGWAVTGNESATGTAFQFDSRENSVAGNRPTLAVTYTPPLTATQLVITSAPTTATAGTPFMITVSAEDGSNNLDADYNNTITLTSSAGSDIAPTSVTLSGGTATFPVTLTAAGGQTITASASGLTSGAATVGVSPGPFAGYNVAVAGSSTLQAGSNFLGIVQAADAFSNPITSYSGPASVTASVSPASDFPISVAINAQGLGFFLGTLQKVGSYTLTAASGSFAGSSSLLTVVPGPAVKLGFGTEPANTPTGVLLSPLTVQILDAFGNVVTGDNSDAVTVSVASGPPGAPGFLASSTTAVTVHNGVATFANLTLVKPGSYTLSAIVPTLYTGSSSMPFTVVPLQVLAGSFTSSSSGFSLSFNAPFLVNSTTPVLYGQGFGSSAPIPSVTLTGPSGPVEGSLVLDAGGNRLTFVATNTASLVNNGMPILPDGTYAVEITSSASTNGLQALNPGGGFLDGTGSGTPGRDFTTTFTVAVASRDIVWIPDIADGPGQPLEAPGNNQFGGGYPVYLDAPTATVTSVQLTLNYNPALLTVGGASGAGFSMLDSIPGQAVMQYSGPALPANTQTPIGFVSATVPRGSAAMPTPYRAKDLLHLSGVTINGSADNVATSDALHVVAYVGDADGNGSYTSADAVLTTRVALQTDDGFAAYPLIDPVIIADTDGSGFVPADAPLQINEAGVGFATANLPSPPIPSGVIFLPIGNNVDPILNLDLKAQSSEQSNGGIVTAAVNIDDADPVGSTGLIRAQLALRYDPGRVSISTGDVHLGSVTSAGIDWALRVTINPATGEIAITLESTTPISSPIGGSLVTIDVHPLVPLAGAAPLVLVPSVNPSGQQIVFTELEDAQGLFTLTLPSWTQSGNSWNPL
jgi:hypothetical protein